MRISPTVMGMFVVPLLKVFQKSTMPGFR